MIWNTPRERQRESRVVRKSKTVRIKQEPQIARISQRSHDGVRWGVKRLRIRSEGAREAGRQSEGRGAASPREETGKIRIIRGLIPRSSSVLFTLSNNLLLGLL